jgi:predicted nucleotidyltransferase
MKTQNDYIQLIASCAQELRQRFGIRTLQVFGSVARNEQHDGSDVDVCVDMPPKLFLIIELKQYLEDLFGCPVDVVRKHRHMNEFLQSQIEKDGIYVLR